MRCTLITGSRADRGALSAIEGSLRMRGHAVTIANVHPMGRVNVGDDACHVAENAIKTVATILGQSSPDWVVVHGDRYEIVAATLAASIMGAPIVHVGGGDVTEGSRDEGYRHAISKMAHLHCVSHADAADRLVAMGEDHENVLVTGDPELDRLRDFQAMHEHDVRRRFGFGGDEGVLALVLMHPNTVGGTAATSAEVDALIAGLEMQPDLALAVVGPNADPGNEVIREKLRGYVRGGRPMAAYRDDVPACVFLSLMRHACVMVGNSSAGIIEAPFFGTSVVNVGDRQKGRPRAACVLDCAPDPRLIRQAVGLAMCGRFKRSTLYGDGCSAPRVVDAMEHRTDPLALLRKGWHEPPAPFRTMARPPRSATAQPPVF